MAPRLSRWIAMTTVAAVLVAVMFLTTGGTPLLYIGYGHVGWDGGQKTTVQLRYDAIQWKLTRVRLAIDSLEFRALLGGELRNTTTDPVVFRRSGARLVADPVLTSELGSLWATLPARRSDIRTVIVIEPERQSWRFGTVHLDSDGLCTVRRMGSDWAKDLTRAIRALAGECFFAESFGIPGPGVAKWMGGLRDGLVWESGARVYDPRIRERFEDLAAPAWFRAGQEEVFGGSWRHWPVRRAERACLVGRPDRCAEATGITSAGWPGIDPNYGYVGQLFPNQALPRDLLVDIGPDRFRRVWTSPDPIAISYERTVGTPMDRWVAGWASGYFGAIQGDNGLSLSGWVGALLWLSLFGLLTSERLRQRSVS